MGPRPHGALRGPQILPSARVSAVTVQENLDAVAGRQRGPGQHRHHKREFRFVHADGRAVGADALDVTNGSPARHLQKPDYSEPEATPTSVQRAARRSAAFGFIQSRLGRGRVVLDIFGGQVASTIA